jgi:hypothetical protein
LSRINKLLRQRFVGDPEQRWALRKEIRQLPALLDQRDPPAVERPRGGLGADPMAPHQEMLADDTKPSANLPFLTRGQVLDLLGDIVPVNFVGSTAPKRQRLMFGPGGDVGVVEPNHFGVRAHCSRSSKCR